MAFTMEGLAWRLCAPCWEEIERILEWAQSKPPRNDAEALNTPIAQGDGAEED
jgi:hypothetical protein